MSSSTEFPAKSPTNSPAKLTTFTTRADTLFAVSFLAVAPEYADLKALVTEKQKKEVQEYLQKVKNKSERERQISKEKSGVWTGSFAKNPISGELVPIFVADYVLAGYGTGAIMGVAGHDERDREFVEAINKQIEEQNLGKTGSKSEQIEAKNDLNQTLTFGEKWDKIDNFRENARVILFDPKTQKYACLLSKKTNSYSTLGGGLEENQTPLEAAKRELKEETGYADFEIVAQLGGKIISYFQDGEVKKERISTGFLAILNSEANDGAFLTDQEKEEGCQHVWLESGEIMDKIKQTCGPDWHYHLEIFRRGVTKAQELGLDKLSCNEIQEFAEIEERAEKVESAVKIVVFNPNLNKYLFIKWNPTLNCSLIGGRIREGETLEMTLRRELEEATGLQNNNWQYLGLPLLDHYFSPKNQRVQSRLFQPFLTITAQTEMAKSEGFELEWLSATEALERYEILTKQGKVETYAEMFKRGVEKVAGLVESKNKQEVLVFGEPFGDELEKPRINVRGVIFDPKTGQYCLVQTDSLPFLPGGGAEEESLEMALVREIKEELGYTDFEIVAQLGGKIISYLKNDKPTHRYVSDTGFLVILNSKNKLQTELSAEEEVKNLQEKWFDKAEIISLWEEHLAQENAELGFARHLEIFKRGVAKAQELGLDKNDSKNDSNETLILGQKPDKIDNFRENARVILFNPKTQKYACLWNKKTDSYSTLGGGLEKNESPLEAGKREITEETGYTDFEIVAQLGGKIISYFKSGEIQKERTSTGFLAVLNSEKNIGVSAHDQEMWGESGYVWLGAKEIEEKIEQTYGPGFAYHLEIFRRGVKKVEELGLDKSDSKMDLQGNLQVSLHTLKPLKAQHNVAYYYLSGNELAPDKPTVKRENVLAILKHWQEDKYLCINWVGESNPWRSFVMGGKEKGESWEVAGKREIVEETGYTDLDFLEKIEGQIHSEYYAKHKDQNRYSVEECCVYQLKSEQKRANFVEEKNHELQWLEKDKVAQFLAQVRGENSNLIFWQRYLNKQTVFTGEGVLFDSGEFSGLKSEVAREKIAQKLEQTGSGRTKVNYKFRDWVFSRQRYWGEPFPFEYIKAEQNSQNSTSEIN